MTLIEKHLEAYPAATINEAELAFLNHIQRWGSQGYPIRKSGRRWSFERLHGAGGSPVLYPTKGAASAAVELYLSQLRDKAAGRPVGSGDPDRGK